MTKFKLTIVLIQIIISCANIHAQNDPSAFAGLELWMRADENVTLVGSSSVSSWVDVIDDQLGFSQNVAGSRGVLIEEIPLLNGYSSISLDGVNDFYSLSTSENEIRTAIVVYKHTTGTSTTFEPLLGHSLFFDFHGMDGTALFRPTSVSPGILAGSCRVNQQTIPALNIVKPTQFSILSITSTSNLRVNQLGRDRNQPRYWKGEFVEIILYSSVLSQVEIESVESYIRERYAPSVDLGDDIVVENFCPIELTVPDRFISVEWSNGSNSNTIEVSESGEYFIQTLDVFGFTSYDTISVSFPGIILESFSLCAGSDSLWNSNLEDFDVVWQDGSVSPIFVISTAGTYFFSATDIEGCVYNSPEVEVLTDNFPNEFGLNEINELCDGNSLVPNDPQGEGVSFLWNTGESTPTIVPLGSGIYNLSAENANGCSSFSTTEVIFIGIAPVANFETSFQCLSSEFTFVDASTSPDDSEIVEWYWDFDGLGSSNSQGPSFAFPEAGIYYVTLTVTSESTCQKSITSEIISTGQSMGNVIFTGNCAGANFTVSAEIDIPFGTIETLNWNIYDLENVLLNEYSGTSFVFYSDQVGYYRYELIVLNSIGCSDTINGFIPVLSPSFCFDPLVIPGLTLWLDATDSLTISGNQVITWGNKASTQNNALTTAIPNRPIYIEVVPELNDHPAIRFDGVNDFMNFGEISNILNVFIVFKHRTGYQPIQAPIFGHPTLFDFHGNTVDSLLFSPTSTSIRIRNGISRLNGIQTPAVLLPKPKEYALMSLQTTDVVTAQYITNDRNLAGRFWDGDYVEILFYSNSLTPEEVVQIEQYLRYKYAPPVDLPREIVVEYGFCDTALAAYKAFYTEYLWSTGSTDSIIHVNQSGIYSVTVTDIFGFTSSDSVKVVFPTDFIQNDFIVCATDTFIYDLDLNPIDYSFLWSTGATTSSVTISEAGTFGVTVTDTLGCSFTTVPVEVSIDLFPETAAINELPTFCLGNTLHLSSGAEEATAYLWSTGATTPLITPQESGTYWVEAVNANGCVGRDTVDVDIVGIAPTAAYSVSAPCAATELNFADITDAGGSSVTAWLWDFGASTATTPAATATFPTAGSYPISLTVTLDNGCTGTLRDTLQVNHLPLVNFSAPLVCAGTEVFYESLSAVPGGVPITSWQWTFGNGTTDTGTIGSTVFESTGANTVTLTVQSAQGCIATLSRNIEVLGSPIPDFNFTTACLGQPTLFTQNVDISQSGPVFYNWQFGNGFFSNFPNTSHLYSNAGLYAVTLTATGNNGGLSGCAASITKNVAVYAPPAGNASFEGACVGGVALFTDLTIPVVLGGVPDVIATRQWSVGGMPSGNAAVQPYPANVEGIFTASMQVITAAGCTASAAGQFTVLPSPVAAFELELPIAAPPFVVTAVNLSVNAAASYWYMNGVYMGEGDSPEFLFPEVGNYTIQLIASSGEGCNDTLVKGFFVVEPMFDIEIREVTTIETDNRLRIHTVLRNLGNVPINGFDIDVQVGLSPNVFAKSDFTIPLGATVPYTLPLTFDRTSDFTMPYVCVEVSNPGGILNQGGSFTETNLDNNRLCAALPVSAPVYTQPYPNPTSGDLNLGIILPAKSDLTLEIVDPLGKMLRRFVLPTEKGYTLHTVPVYDLTEGLYIIRYSVGDDVQTRRFVVLKY